MRRFHCFQDEIPNASLAINVVDRRLVITSIITRLQDMTMDFRKYNNLLMYHYELLVT